MLITRLSRFEYKLQSFGDYTDVLKSFFKTVVKEEPDQAIHEDYWLRTISYMVGSYVLSKEVNYDPVSENIKVLVDNDIIRELLPNYDGSIIVYVSKLVFNNPVTKDKEERKAFGYYTLS